MAPRKNTQSPEGSLAGNVPEQTEGDSAAGDVNDQQRGGDTLKGQSVAADQDEDVALTALQKAISEVLDVPPAILPDPIRIRTTHRMAMATDTIIHDGVHFAPGDPVAVTELQFAALVKSKAVFDEDWDDLDLEDTEDR